MTPAMTLDDPDKLAVAFWADAAPPMAGAVAAVGALFHDARTTVRDGARDSRRGRQGRSPVRFADGWKAFVAHVSIWGSGS